MCVYDPRQFADIGANAAVDSEVVAPVYVDGNGSAIPHRHGLRAMRTGHRHYVKITAFGNEFLLNMTHSRGFMASGVVVEHRANATAEILRTNEADCYHNGLVIMGNAAVGRVALSSCRGLVRRMHCIYVLFFYFAQFCKIAAPLAHLFLSDPVYFF